MSKVEQRDGQPIYWFDGKTPKIKRIGDDGLPVTEKVTAKPFRRFLKPSGDIVQLDLSPAAADRNVRGAYGTNRVEKKVRDGFLPADECPMVTGRMPMGLRTDSDKACAEYMNQAGMSVTKPKLDPCVHLKRVQTSFCEKHAAVAKDWEGRFKSDATKMLDVLVAREVREATEAQPAKAKAKTDETPRPKK